MAKNYRPELSSSGLSPTYSTNVIDEYGELRESRIAGEFPLTLYVDKREIVTLMTLGREPELLTLGYLKNQGLLHDLEAVKSVQVDWESEAVAVTTTSSHAGWDKILQKRTVTTGCGQGTVFGDILDRLEAIELPQPRIKQSRIYALLRSLNEYNEVYKNAGAVHGCALCKDDQIISFVEDVGRHNAVDAIAGKMWLEGIDGGDKYFYTTGRLTSEMVIKVALMGIPVLLSRSGVTRMGLELAQQIGVAMLARSKGQHFLIYNGAEQIELDAIPARKPGMSSRP